MITQRMPHVLQVAIYKRTEYLETQIATRRAAGLPVNYFEAERDAILWLLDASQVPHERRGPETTDLAKPLPLPMDRQREIVAAFRRGETLDQIAAAFKFPLRAVVNTLNEAGYAVAIVTEAHRREGLSQ
jgi:hypothetical protein